MSPHLSGSTRRSLAALACGLVLALTVFSASGGLHAWLHSDAPSQNEATCIVGMFGSGVALPLGSDLVAGHIGWRQWIAPSAEPVRLTPPRYLRLPGRGPPRV